MATGTTKQTEVVLAHHMEVIVAKDVDGILEEFTEDSVLFTLDGKVEGLTALRGFFEPYVAGLTDELLASFQMDRQEVHGELACKYGTGQHHPPWHRHDYRPEREDQISDLFRVHG